jgi:hypothetical protein
MFQRNRLFILTILLVSTTGALSFYVGRRLAPDDYVAINSRYIDRSKLEFVQALERQRGAVDDLNEKNRKYIAIDGDNQYCIFAFFHPNVPVSSLFDDAYCFRKSDGKYVGVL